MVPVSFRRVLPLSAALGVGIGLAGAAFYVLWHTLLDLVWAHLPNPLHRIWVSGLAGLLIGLIIYRLWDPGTVSDIISHFHEKGRLPDKDNKPIVPLSLVSLVAGASAGPEGMLTQVCGSMGAWLADRFRAPDLTRILTQAGMGAGFGAFLGAPVGGAILWLEMPHKKGLEYYEALIPTMTASLVGHLVMAGLLHINLLPAWHPSAVTSSSFTALLSAAGMGLLAGGAALLYAQIFRGVGAGFAALKLPVWAKTTLAGLIIGLLGALFPLTYFYGKNELNGLMSGSFPLLMLLGILLAKMLAASVTIKGQWQGGLIIPQMFMGAALGKLTAMLVPGVDPTLAMLTGMAAFNAAATHTPLASGLIVIALSGFGGAIPIFLASLVGFLVGQQVEMIGNKRHRTEWPALAGVAAARADEPSAASAIGAVGD